MNQQETELLRKMVAEIKADLKSLKHLILERDTSQGDRITALERELKGRSEDPDNLDESDIEVARLKLFKELMEKVSTMGETFAEFAFKLGEVVAQQHMDKARFEDLELKLGTVVAEQNGMCTRMDIIEDDIVRLKADVRPLENR